MHATFCEILGKKRKCKCKTETINGDLAAKLGKRYVFSQCVFSSKSAPYLAIHDPALLERLGYKIRMEDVKVWAKLVRFDLFQRHNLLPPDPRYHKYLCKSIKFLNYMKYNYHSIQDPFATKRTYDWWKNNDETGMICANYEWLNGNYTNEPDIYTIFKCKRFDMINQPFFADEDLIIRLTKDNNTDALNFLKNQLDGWVYHINSADWILENNFQLNFCGNIDVITEWYNRTGELYSDWTVNYIAHKGIYKMEYDPFDHLEEYFIHNKKLACYI